MKKAVLSIAFLMCVVGPAFGQQPAFPSKPIQVVVPFPPGGGADLVARVLGERMTANLGQQVVVVNRGGAGGIIASESVLRAPADGHTLFLVATNHAVNPHLYKKLPYDTFTDFTPVALVGVSPSILSVHPSLPVKTVKDLIDLAKAHPGQINYASLSLGGSSHLAAELFNIMGGVKLHAVQYKGAGPGVIDVLGGQVPMMFGNMPVTLPHASSGRLRPIAVTSLKRSPLVPDLPTISDSGVKGYEAREWWGVVAAAKTPEPLIARMNQEIVKATGSPEAREKLSALGAELSAGSPADFGAFLKAESAKWGKVVEKAGIQAN